MKNRICPYKDHCHDAGECESCDFGKKFTFLSNKIKRLEAKKDALVEENGRLLKELLEAESVRYGEWDKIPNTYLSVASKDGHYSGAATSCSICHEVNPNAYKTNYCPNCGAKMRKEPE